MPEQMNTKQSSVSVSDSDYQFHEYGRKAFRRWNLNHLLYGQYVTFIYYWSFWNKNYKKELSFSWKIPNTLYDWLNYDTVNCC